MANEKSCLCRGGDYPHTIGSVVGSLPCKFTGDVMAGRARDVAAKKLGNQLAKLVQKFMAFDPRERENVVSTAMYQLFGEEMAGARDMAELMDKIVDDRRTARSTVDPGPNAPRVYKSVYCSRLHQGAVAQWLQRKMKRLAKDRPEWGFDLDQEFDECDDVPEGEEPQAVESTFYPLLKCADELMASRALTYLIGFHGLGDLAWQHSGLGITVGLFVPRPVDSAALSINTERACFGSKNPHLSALVPLQGFRRVKESK